MTLHAFVFSADFPDVPGRDGVSSPRALSSIRHPATTVDVPDRALVTTIREGHEAVAREAFDTLYAMTYERLVRFVARFVSDADVAHDVVQDVFVSLWVTRATWHAPGGSLPYCYSAVRNRALKQLRHEAVVHYADPAALPAPTSAARPDVAAEEGEFDLALRATLAELPERRRTAFLLRAVDGLGYDAIGVVLGISGPAAYKQVIAAVHILRERLGRFRG